jgi:hypothetical protein
MEQATTASRPIVLIRGVSVLHDEADWTALQVIGDSGPRAVDNRLYEETAKGLPPS